MHHKHSAIFYVLIDDILSYEVCNKSTNFGIIVLILSHFEKKNNGYIRKQVLSDFRCGALLFMVILVIYKYQNR